jgi:hypothetical protein
MSVSCEPVDQQAIREEHSGPCALPSPGNSLFRAEFGRIVFAVTEKDILIVVGVILLLAALLALLVAARVRAGLAAKFAVAVLLIGFAATSSLVVVVLYIFAMMWPDRWREGLSYALVKKALVMGVLTLVPFAAVIGILWAKLRGVHQVTQKRLEESQKPREPEEPAESERK